MCCTCFRGAKRGKGAKTPAEAKPELTFTISAEPVSSIHESVEAYHIRSEQLPPAVMAIGRLFLDLFLSVDDEKEQRAVLKALIGSDEFYNQLKDSAAKY